jgi:site-specific DNA recombinase
MKKALIYLRVSDEMQELKDSLNKQEEQAINYCNFKNYTIYKVIKEVGSGRRRDQREGFIELEKEIARNTFDVLIFYELSRLARNQYLLHNLIHNLKINRISFESITESYLNSDSPTSKMMLGFLASMAEIESDMTSKRVRNRMKHYASEGYWMFQPPRGYKLEEKILRIHDEEAEVVRDIFREFIAGASIKKLKAAYNLSDPGIKNLLSNVAYIGKTKFGFAGRDNHTGKRVNNLPGEVFEGKHEAIIDEKTFNMAQNILNNKKRKYKSYIVDNKFLLTGLIKHNCGYSANGKRQKSGYTLYRCRDCEKSIPAKLVEEVIVEEFKNYCKGLKYFKNKRISKKKNKSLNKLSTLKFKRSRIVESYMDGNINREYYLKLIDEIDIEIDTIKNSIGEKENNVPKIFTDNYDLLLQMVNTFDNKTIVEKNKILKLFIEAIIYKDKESELEIIYKI